MSVDRTLHVRSGASSDRNVLRRAERIAIMTDNGDFDPDASSPLGLRKTRVKTARKAPKKAAAPEAAETAEGAEGAEEAAAETTES